MTNQPLCAVDQRPVHDGGQLCPACWADLRQDLAELPELVYDLDRIMARLTKTGGSPIGIVVRAERGLTFDERAGDLLRELHNTLGGWVRVIFEDTDPLAGQVVCSLCHVDQRKHAEGPAPVRREWWLLTAPIGIRDEPADLAQWLGQHEREIRRHEAAGDLWSEIHRLANRARDLVDQHRGGRVYIGVCSAHIGDIDGDIDGDAHPGFEPQPVYCDAELYVHDGRPTAICRACGTEHDIAERRAIMLDAMDDELLTAAEMTRAFATYGGIELKADRLRQWAHRGKIYAHPPRLGERANRYYVGSVRLLLDREIVD